MKLPIVALLIICADAPTLAQDADIALPSGRIVTPHDVIDDTEGDAMRFRFIEPDLAMVIDVIGYERLEADMRFLCEDYALPRLDDMPARIVVSVSDRPVPFGTRAPEASQVFEIYRPEGGACIWEGF